MMIDRIIKSLQSSGVKEWKLMEKNVKSKELFFIKDTLDMNRAKDVTKYELTVYKRFSEGGKDYMGSSTILIHPTMTDDEINEVVKKALFSAGFVKNAPYPLVDAVKKDLRRSSDALDKINDIADAIFVSDHKKSWLNSTEVFLNVENLRILNSNGLDVAFDRERLEIEFITTCKGEKEEVELYWNVKTSDLSLENISSKVSEALNVTVDRAFAKPTPKVKDIPVIFDEVGTKEILSYYVEKSSALKVYEHMSNAKIGDKLQGDFKGSPITLSIDPKVNGSYFSQPFDEDGLELKRVKVMDNGTLVSYWGNVRFSHYLGVKPTGNMTNFVVESGKKSIEELREGKYIELKTFSDFQMNSLTGDFAGEIRLGWYHDGEKKIPITGGSVSGNITDAQETLELSKETIQDGNYFGPRALKVYNAKIAGIE
jgi:predicted Zn-dependent protease